jgi:cell division protein FtsN
MDKYLLEILKEMNTIIIPGLGALTITNDSTGEIMFMPYLKFDDGKLAKYIAEKEGWSENDANNLIAKYVREIEAKLNTGDTYDMYRFGSFAKNASGDVEFTRWNESKESEVNYVEPSLVNDTLEELKEDPIVTVEEEIPAEPQSDTEHSDLAPVEVVAHVPVEKEEVIMVEEAQVTEYVPDPVTSETKFDLYTEEDQWNDDLDLPPINAKVERAKKPILEKTQKDNKRKKPMMIILLVAGVLLVGGTLTVAMFYNSVSEIGKEKVAKTEGTQKAPETKETETVTEPINSQAGEENSTNVEPETIPSETDVNEESVGSGNMIQTSTGQIDPARPYHLIAGAFIVRENADRFRDKLRVSGNSNAEIIGRFDGLFVVSACSYSSNEEAMNAKKENTTISRSWIFRWP